MLAAVNIEGWVTPSELAFLQAIMFVLPPGARVVEVGSWKGRSTVAICEALKQIDGRLTAVDTFRGDTDTGDATGVEQEFRANTAPFSGLLDVVVADSRAAAEDVDDESLDCVFIDAYHAYEAVSADIRAWAPKVKPGGILCGHDWGWPSVKVAVREAFGRSVSAWETIWYTRSTSRGVHPVAIIEKHARRAVGHLDHRE